MSRIVEVLPEAEAEVLLNSDWYETRGVSLGVQFLDDVQRALEALADEDALTSWVPHVPRSLGARRLRLTRFPHQLVFVERGQVRLVAAVPHLRREPGYWRPRLVRAPGP